MGAHAGRPLQRAFRGLLKRRGRAKERRRPLGPQRPSRPQVDLSRSHCTVRTPMWRLGQAKPQSVCCLLPGCRLICRLRASRSRSHRTIYARPLRLNRAGQTSARRILARPPRPRYLRAGRGKAPWPASVRRSPSQAKTVDWREVRRARRSRTLRLNPPNPGGRGCSNEAPPASGLE